MTSPRRIRIPVNHFAQLERYNAHLGRWITLGTVGRLVVARALYRAVVAEHGCMVRVVDAAQPWRVLWPLEDCPFDVPAICAHCGRVELLREAIAPDGRLYDLCEACAHGGY